VNEFAVLADGFGRSHVAHTAPDGLAFTEKPIATG
jgi:hypothetical protein